LAVTQQQAWDALNDPEVLKLCIPGCDRIEQTGDDQYALGLAVKVGPVAARFNGKIQLADVLPPNSYTIAFEGQGGAAGFGKGSARVQLAPPAEGAGCELSYSAQAQVGGKIAQVGQRLVDGVARSMAEEFFRRFDEEMNRRHPQAPVAEAALPPAAEPLPAPPARKRIAAWVWLAAGTVILGAVVFLGR
jgi:carbon monoxide dehydrogenase subunit G